ncbi:hypothetical protein AB3R30_26835 [Leptolyngbyaceae cyanobacterium UHCC 1019]
MLTPQTSKISWLKIILIPIFCYLPTIGLLWMSVSFLKPDGISQVDKDIKNVPETAKKIPQNEISKSNTSEIAIANVKESENKVSSQQLARDEMEKLKADLKADLFSVISFPVVFAVASIFAALGASQSCRNRLMPPE